MKTIELVSEKLYGFAEKFSDWFAFLLTGLLFVCGFFQTSYAVDMDSQTMAYRWDRLYLVIPLMVLVFFLGGLLVRWVMAKAERRYGIFRRIVLFWLFATGVLLILFVRSYPGADPQTVYTIAKQFAVSDYGAISEEGSYLSYYPHQVGLCLLTSWAIRFWNLLPVREEPYHFLKLINVLLMMLLTLLLSETVHRIWENVKADVILLLLLGTNLSLIFFSSFVYGEILSLTPFAGSLLCLVLFLGERVRWKRICEGAGTALCLALSIMTRKNSLILLIAVVIVLVFEGIRRRRPGLFALTAVVLAAGLGILPATQSWLEGKGGAKLESGVTPLSYLAMGMQEASRGPGWYNGFNFYTYQDCGLDAEAENELSRIAIDGRLDYFRSEPLEALHFYRKKFLSQWVDGTYASRQATWSTMSSRGPVVSSLYTGALAEVFVGWCDLWQDFLYLGAFLYWLARVRKTDGRLYSSISMIGVMGGFLFHMMWEANSRYIFPYSILLVPYAAMGLAEGKMLLADLVAGIQRILGKWQK